MEETSLKSRMRDEFRSGLPTNYKAAKDSTHPTGTRAARVALVSEPKLWQGVRYQKAEFATGLYSYLLLT